eukprot:TRINITY_DN8508_c0_g2_i2.p1 TRINITY_DN8508_c0_g2~~TRINITY_DN8508_c0_g2_i2.p1  ORF type:complete len:749 (-),score=150.74 TRINITY_DN8508_c0_g2_i2:119-2365(-)
MFRPSNAIKEENSDDEDLVISPLECPICLERMEEVAFLHVDPTSPSSSSPSSPSTHTPHTHFCTCCLKCAKRIEDKCKSTGKPFQCAFCRRNIIGYSKNRSASDLIIEVNKYVSLFNNERQEKSSLENNVSELRSDIARLRTEEQRLRDVRHMFESIQEEKFIAEGQVKRLQAEINEKTEEVTRLEERARESSMRSVRYQNEINTLRFELEKERATVGDFEMRIRENIERGKESNMRVFEMEEMNSTLKSQLQEAQQQLLQQQSMNEELQTSLRKLQHDYAVSTETISQLEGVLHKRQDTLKKMESEKYHLSKLHAEHDSILHQLQTNLAKAEEERNGYKDKVMRLQRELENFKIERERRKSELPDVNPNTTNGWGSWVMNKAGNLWGVSAGKTDRPKSALIKSFGDYLMQERRGTKLDSNVWRAVNTHNKTSVILKKSPQPIPKGGNVGKNEMINIFRETMILSRLNNVNILKLEGVTVDQKGYLYQVLSPFVEMDLEYSISALKLNPTQIKSILCQLLKAVHYLHGLEIVHKNIKPTSILTFEDLTIKLCGFGSARSIISLEDQPGGKISDVESSSLRYTAPEVLLVYNGTITQSTINNWKASDMFSVGCVMAELLSGKPLLRGSDAISLISHLNAITECKPSDSSILKDFGVQISPNTVSQPLSSIIASNPSISNHPSFSDAISLLSRLVCFDPNRRLTAIEALNHRYFADRFHGSEIRNTLAIPEEFTDRCVEGFVKENLVGIF